MATFTDALGYAPSQLRLSNLHLKDQQREAILAVYKKHDTFVFLPTGFGKSICFQVLPFLFDHKLGLVQGQNRSCVVIVFPLVSLMVDQIRILRERVQSGVQAVVITGLRESSIVDREFRATEKNLQSATFIFSSPEALAAIR